MLPLTSETPCCNTFPPTQKSEILIHTQDKKDSRNVEERQMIACHL